MKKISAEEFANNINKYVLKTKNQPIQISFNKKEKAMLISLKVYNKWVNLAKKMGGKSAEDEI